MFLHCFETRKQADIVIKIFYNQVFKALQKIFIG